MPVYTQRLLVLLFGTFRVIATNSERAGTGMSSEAIGVSVAPSFFQSCVSDGKNVRMDDVLRFKVSLSKHIYLYIVKVGFFFFLKSLTCRVYTERIINSGSSNR